MTNLSLNGSRRKRLKDAEPSASSQDSRASIVPLPIALVLAIVLAVWVFAPDRVDSALDRTVSAVAGNEATNRVWTSVASAFTSEDDSEKAQIASVSPAPPSGAPILQQYESVTTGSTGRVVLTSGHDILQLDPATTILVRDSGLDDSTAIIELIDGTVHVEAAKRTDGGTLSIETEYLVATVKGTKFDVVATAGGAAVSVTEGVVEVRSTASSDGVDVTPGNTAVVLAASAVPALDPTPASGALAAIEAAHIHSDSAGRPPNSNHHQR